MGIYILLVCICLIILAAVVISFISCKKIDKEFADRMNEIEYRHTKNDEYFEYRTSVCDSMSAKLDEIGRLNDHLQDLRKTMHDCLDSKDEDGFHAAEVDFNTTLAEIEYEWDLYEKLKQKYSDIGDMPYPSYD